MTCWNTKSIFLHSVNNFTIYCSLQDFKWSNWNILLYCSTVWMAILLANSLTLPCFQSPPMLTACLLSLLLEVQYQLIIKLPSCVQSLTLSQRIGTWPVFDHRPSHSNVPNRQEKPHFHRQISCFAMSFSFINKLLFSWFQEHVVFTNVASYVWVLCLYPRLT